MSTERQESRLIRSLSFTDLMGIAVGQIVGAGIMSSTGIAIGMTGTGVVLAFLISPILSILSIYPIAILGSAVPTTGGPYRYTSRLLGKSCGMVYLLLHITTNVMIAVFALSFASYFVSIVTGYSQHIVAMVVLTLFYVVNLIGTKQTARLNTIMSFFLIGGLLLFISFGLRKVNLTYIIDPKHLFPNGTMAFISTLALLSSATSGAQVVAELGGEVRDAGNVIPKVIIASTFGVGIFYVLIAIVAAGILPIKIVANQPLSFVAKETMPVFAFYLFVIGAALGATATTLNATLSWVTKPLLVACDDGMLPKTFGTVSSKGVPYKLLTFFYIIGMLPLLMRLNLAFVTKFTTANSLLNKIFFCLSLYVLASKNKEIIEKSTLKISVEKAKFYSIVAIIVLCILSSSLLMNLSSGVVAFIVVLILMSLIYTKLVTKNVTIENDLNMDYTTR